MSCASIRRSSSAAVRAHNEFSSSIVLIRGATARSRLVGPLPESDAGVVAILGEGYRSLAEGAKVSYEAEAGDKGPKAVNIQPI